MKFKEISQIQNEERIKKKKELEMELIKLNTQVATGTPPKNAGSIRRIKKDIAKINFLNAKDEKIKLSQSKTTSKVVNESDLPKADDSENKKTKKTKIKK